MGYLSHHHLFVTLTCTVHGLYQSISSICQPACTVHGLSESVSSICQPDMYSTWAIWVSTIYPSTRHVQYMGYLSQYHLFVNQICTVHGLFESVPYIRQPDMYSTWAIWISIIYLSTRHVQYMGNLSQYHLFVNQICTVHGLSESVSSICQPDMYSTWAIWVSIIYPSIRYVQYMGYLSQYHLSVNQTRAVHGWVSIIYSSTRFVQYMGYLSQYHLSVNQTRAVHGWVSIIYSSTRFVQYMGYLSHYHLSVNQICTVHGLFESVSSIRQSDMYSTWAIWVSIIYLSTRHVLYMSESVSSIRQPELYSTWAIWVSIIYPSIIYVQYMGYLSLYHLSVNRTCTVHGLSESVSPIRQSDMYSTWAIWVSIIYLSIRYVQYMGYLSQYHLSVNQICTVHGLSESVSSICQSDMYSTWAIWVSIIYLSTRYVQYMGYLSQYHLSVNQICTVHGLSESVSSIRQSDMYSTWAIWVSSIYLSTGHVQYMGYLSQYHLSVNQICTVHGLSESVSSIRQSDMYSTWAIWVSIIYLSTGHVQYMGYLSQYHLSVNQICTVHGLSESVSSICQPDMYSTWAIWVSIIYPSIIYVQYMGYLSLYHLSVNRTCTVHVLSGLTTPNASPIEIHVKCLNSTGRFYFFLPSPLSSAAYHNEALTVHFQKQLR